MVAHFMRYVNTAIKRLCRIVRETGFNMKMYILVREDVPLGIAMNAVGHASLKCYLEFKDHPDMQDWLKNSFKKVTCKVSDEEMGRAALSVAIADGDYVEITESALDGESVAIAFRPQAEWPKCFKYFGMYK